MYPLIRAQDWQQNFCLLIVFWNKNTQKFCCKSCAIIKGYIEQNILFQAHFKILQYNDHELHQKKGFVEFIPFTIFT